MHCFSSEEKVPVVVICKEGDADSLLENQIAHHYWFTWKKVRLYKMAPIANFLGKIKLNYLENLGLEIILNIEIRIK